MIAGHHNPVATRITSWLKGQKGFLAIAAVLAAGILARPVAPWLIRIIPAAAILVYLGLLTFRLPARLRNWLLAMGTLALVCNVAVSIVQVRFYDAAEPSLWLDDHTYYLEGESLANAWKRGFYPDITKSGSRPYMGSLHVDFQRTLAGLFWLFGPSTLVGLLLNSFCNALLAVCAGLCAWLTFRDPVSEQPNHGSEAALAAAIASLLAAYHPQQFYWGHLLLKDCYTACWFMVALTLSLAAASNRSATAATLLVCALCHLAQTRMYAAVAIVGGFTSYFLMLVPRRLAITFCAGAALALYLVANYTDAPGRVVSQMLFSIGQLLPHSQEGPLQVLGHLGAAIPRMLLASYAWVPAYSSAVPLYGVYGGMWFLYVIVYPGAVNGLMRTFSRNVRLSSIPLMSVVLGFVVLMASVHGGVANRQRLFLEYVAIMFAGYGYVAPRRKVFLIYYALLLTYIIGHLITVMIRF